MPFDQAVELPGSSLVETNNWVTQSLCLKERKKEKNYVGGKIPPYIN